MTRRSLKPQLNQIRAWVQQGRTDAWIAHQLEVTVQQIDSFKREQGLVADGEVAVATAAVDLRDEDDALVAAELEAAEAKAAEEARLAEEARAAQEAARGDDDSEESSLDEPAKSGGSRSRRGSGRKANGLEGTFDHGEEGYGLWLDPAVADDPVYAEHWAGHRSVEVTIEEDTIVIRRSGNET